MTDMIITHKKDLIAPTSGTDDKVYGVDWIEDHKIIPGKIYLNAAKTLWIEANGDWIEFHYPDAGGIRDVPY